MPIWLRNFTFKKLEEYYKKKEEANSKANKQLKNSNEIHESTICLPSYGVSQKKIKYICYLIKLYINKKLKK